MATISSPGWRPARAAGDPGATATTRGRDIARQDRRRAQPVSAAPGPRRRLAGPVPGPVRCAGSLGVDVDRVLLASPRGFCAGVEMAIKALAWMTRVFEPPVYCYHEIVHNQVVVERFRQLGVVFVDDVAEVPAGGAADAVGPRLAPGGGRRGPGPGRRGRQRGVPAGQEGPPRGQGAGRKGYTIVYVGHEGHQEAIGTMAVAPDGGAPGRARGRARGPARPGRAGRLPGPDHPGRRRVGRPPGRGPARWPDLWVPGH